MAKIVKETLHVKGIDIGIYTTNFENEYEAWGNLMIIPIVLNNIKYRTRYQCHEYN